MQSAHESNCHVLEDWPLDRASWCSLHNGDYGQRKEAKKFKDRKLLLLKKANIELNNYQF